MCLALLRRTLAVLFALRSARLLRRTRRALVRPALALRSIDLRTILPAIRALGLGEFALLRHFRLLPLALRALGPGLLLLLRWALVAALLLIAALMIAAAATVALVFSASIASATSIASASSAPSIASATPAAFVAAALMAIAVFVARTLFARRPCRAHGGFIGRLLLCSFLCLDRRTGDRNPERAGSWT